MAWVREHLMPGLVSEEGGSSGVHTGDLRSRLVPWELVPNAPVLREGGLGTCSAGRGLGGPSRGHIDPSPPLGPLACRGSWCTKEVSPSITRDSDRGHTPCLREQGDPPGQTHHFLTQPLPGKSLSAAKRMGFHPEQDLNGFETAVQARSTVPTRIWPHHSSV